MTSEFLSTNKQEWGSWQHWLYFFGVILPFIIFEIEYTYSDNTNSSNLIWLGLILLGPIISIVAIVFSNLSMQKSVLWTLLIPVLFTLLFLVFWFGGSSLLDRPFFPTD